MRRHRRILGAALGLASSAFMLAACASETAPASREAPSMSSEPPYTGGLGPSGLATGAGVLDGSRWTVRTLNGAEAPPDYAPTLVFEGRGVSGSTGCNRYFGQVSASDGGLALAPMGVSRRACAPEIMDLEREFLAALRAVDSFTQRADDRLVLSAGAEPMIEAVRSR
jgi:heat shock protein HslJ